MENLLEIIAFVFLLISVVFMVSSVMDSHRKSSKFWIYEYRTCAMMVTFVAFALFFLAASGRIILA